MWQIGLRSGWADGADHVGHVKHAYRKETRDPSRVGIDPVQAAVVEHMFAWYMDPQQAVSLYEVAKRLSEAQIPTPQGGKRWNVASVRGILRSPTYTGVA